MNPDTPNKKDIRRFYDLLGHKDQTEIRLIPPIKQEWVSTEKEFLSVCERYNGKKNVYAGLNERKLNGSKTEDVISLETIILDIDPIRKPQDKDEEKLKDLNKHNATNSEIEKTRKDVEKISAWYVKQGFKSPCIAFSGNGFYVISKIPHIDLSDENRDTIQKGLELFCKEIQDKFNNENTHIDSTFDLARIYKVIGTQALKKETPERPNRYSHFITENDPEPDQALCEYILSLREPEKEISQTADKGIELKDFEFCCKFDDTLRELYDGDISGYKSRSEAEEGLVFKLVYYGFSDSQIRQIMSGSKIGRWNEKPKKTQDKDIQKAFENVTDRFDWNESKQEPITLSYSTGHLPYFSDLMTALALFGKDYVLIGKLLWYQLVSVNIPIEYKPLCLGSVETDLRLHGVYVLNAGHGKQNIKTLIQRVLGNVGLIVSTPVSYHQEQLIGKILKRREKDQKIGEEITKIIQNKGYLADDYLFIDEGYLFFTSTETKYEQARSYIATALDPYPNNIVYKKAVDDLREQGEVLNYAPHIVMGVALQPERIPEHIISRGLLRRYLVVWVQCNEDDKKRAFKERLEERDTETTRNNFSEYLKSIQENDFTQNKQRKVVFSKEAVTRIQELHTELLTVGGSINTKCSNFAEIVEFTAEDYLIKLSSILAIGRGHYTIETEDVELAYCDLFEFFWSCLNYVNCIVQGNFDYGKSWMGAGEKEIECLEYLNDNEAISFETSNISITDFLECVQDVYSCEIRTAQRRKNHFFKRGWIDLKKGQHDSKVWLNFTPELRKKLNRFDFSQSEYVRIVTKNKEICSKKLDMSDRSDTSEREKEIPEMSEVSEVTSAYTKNYTKNTPEMSEVSEVTPPQNQKNLSEKTKKLYSLCENIMDSSGLIGKQRIISEATKHLKFPRKLTDKEKEREIRKLILTLEKEKLLTKTRDGLYEMKKKQKVLEEKIE
ncbi:MAG: hypothetical protein JW778_04005 [Candidatus Altiarchaeota archaeon]|nr:hypothetical protein [Candidatus Altiarchaeota archaeon]